MVGFIKGLFGSKKPKTESVEPRRAPAESPETAKTYFLSADEAKTYGDIDYMRTPKKTRRTFPKTASNQKGAELIQSVSSMEIKRDGQGLPISEVAPTSSTPEPSSQTTERRRSDSSMDMFRNMAKDIKR